MRVGQILNSKAGAPYIKIDKDTVLKVGDVLFLNKPADEIDNAVERGKLTQEQAEAKKAKVPDFVRYNINQKVDNAATTSSNAEQF
jgi:hypothetical protein